MKLKQLFRNATLSAFFTLAASSALGQPANLTNDVQLWLRADVGVTTNAAGGVTQWADSGTFANNAVQITDAAAPALILNALTNRPVLRFDGVDDFMDVADSDSLSGTGDISSFFVVKFDDFANYRAVWGKTAVNYPAPTDIYAQPGSGVLSVFRGDGTPNNVGAVNSAQPLRANAYLVLGFSVEGSTLTHYLNNQENGSGTITTNTADGNTSLKIGTRSDFATRLKGDLAEVLIFNRALSSQDRSNVFHYLQTKYNLLNLTPNISLATSPAGPNVNVGDEIRLNATANDLDGTIARVDFFSHGTLIGTASQPPYSMRVRVDSAGPIQFSARATDDKGAIANTAPINMTALPAGTSELPTAGLQLWLKADAGVSVDGNGGVNQWLDQSGNANHALQIDPNLTPVFTNNAINGQPGIRFDGVNDFLEIADSDSLSITNDITSFFVLRFADFATFRAIWAKTTVNLPNPTDIYVQPSNRRLRLYRGNGVSTGIQPSDATEPFIAGNSMLAGFTIGGNAVNHYFNGLLNGSSTMTVRPTDGNGSLRIGRRHDTTTWMRGEIAEIVIYDRALSANERRDVERYLAEKYSTPALLQRVNDIPNVAITGPTDEILHAPNTFTVSASANDADGSIVSVQFLANGASLAVDSNAPYAAQLTLPYGGQVTLSAIAIDNLGARRTSASVAFCVQGPGRPHGLVGYWPLDGDATAIVGASGIMVSNPVVTLDRNDLPNGALEFDGLLQQRVEIPGGGGLNAARRGTISLWVKWTGIQDIGPVESAAGAVLSRQRDGSFSDAILHLNNADPNAAVLIWRQTGAPAPIAATGGAVVGADTWHHIAVVFTETNSQLYLDGIPDGALGNGGIMRDSTLAPLAIGAWIGGGESYATASIDDVATWNRVLSSDEIQILALQGATPFDLLVAPDCLTIERGQTTVKVSWESGAILEGASEVTGPYTEVENAASPYESDVASAPRFFRLRSR